MQVCERQPRFRPIEKCGIFMPLNVASLRLMGVSMYEQEKVQKGRMIGYAVGLIVFVAVVAWRFLVR